mmetsp:Transcript_19700/g.55376  ORF Transcript_19700/g.55376 Transcript_19700/m.55376 type:complete len:236 (+) Transcript_19700:613-1320(+)
MDPIRRGSLSWSRGMRVLSSTARSAASNSSAAMSCCTLAVASFMLSTPARAGSGCALGPLNLPCSRLPNLSGYIMPVGVHQNNTTFSSSVISSTSQPTALEKCAFDSPSLRKYAAWRRSWRMGMASWLVPTNSFVVVSDNLSSIAVPFSTSSESCKRNMVWLTKFGCSRHASSHLQSNTVSPGYSARLCSGPKEMRSLSGPMPWQASPVASFSDTLSWYGSSTYARSCSFREMQF